VHVVCVRVAALFGRVVVLFGHGPFCHFCNDDVAVCNGPVLVNFEKQVKIAMITTSNHVVRTVRAVLPFVFGFGINIFKRFNEIVDSTMYQFGFRRVAVPVQIKLVSDGHLCWLFEYFGVPCGRRNAAC
jgi:hypothetical protein